MKKVVGLGACVLDTLISCDTYPTEDKKQKAESFSAFCLVGVIGAQQRDDLLVLLLHGAIGQGDDVDITEYAEPEAHCPCVGLLQCIALFLNRACDLFVDQRFYKDDHRSGDDEDQKV